MPLLCANCATRPVAVKSQGLCRACHLYRWRKLKAEAQGKGAAYDAPVEVTEARRRKAASVAATYALVESSGGE